jgi:hypothetical protein
MWDAIAFGLVAFGFCVLKYWLWLQCHEPLTDHYDKPRSEQWLYDDSDRR